MAIGKIADEDLQRVTVHTQDHTGSIRINQPVAPSAGPITKAALTALTARSAGWYRQGLCRVTLLLAAAVFDQRRGRPPG